MKARAGRLQSGVRTGARGRFFKMVKAKRGSGEIREDIAPLPLLGTPGQPLGGLILLSVKARDVALPTEPDARLSPVSFSLAWTSSLLAICV